jgi:hypothetical protein
MYGKQKLMVLGPALLALLALGPTSTSHASDTPNPTPSAAASVPHNGAATGASVLEEQPPWSGYWEGYRDGYRAAGQDCRRRQMQSFRGNPRMSQYDRGWIAGYNAGHRRFCTIVE